MEQQATKVAAYIAERIDYCEKRQNQIAREVGFDKPNMISMIRSGATKLPISKVPAMARAIAVDPMELLVRCLKEYQPENWAAIEPLLELGLSPDERRLVQALRVSVGGPYLAAMNDEAKSHLEAFIECLREEQHSASIQ